MGWQDAPVVSNGMPAWSSAPIVGAPDPMPTGSESNGNDILNSARDIALSGIQNISESIRGNSPPPSGILDQAKRAGQMGLGFLQLAGAAPGAVLHAGVGLPVERATGSPTAGFIAETVAGLGAPFALNKGLGAAQDIASGDGILGRLSQSESSGAAPKVPTPPASAAMQELAPLVKASKGTGFGRTMFMKEPNSLEVGLEANKNISKSYDTDLSHQRNLYQKLDQHGSVFSVKAPDLYNKLDDLIGYLKDKVLPGSKEQMALSNLSEIRDNLQSKYSVDAAPVMLDEFGPVSGGGATNAYGVSPSDLVDIKTALNSGLGANKFLTAGGGKTLAFKNYVNDALQEASSLSPEFGSALKAAESQAAKVGQYKSPSLKPFWQPEDYVAYKAKINNPQHPGYADGTVSRASEILKNLNTDKTGRIRAVSNALPTEARDKVLRAAIIQAKKSQPNLINAAAKLKTGNVSGAVQTLVPKPTPLLNTVKNLKKANVK